MNIYVGNLPKTTDEETVRKLFEEYGEVTEVKLIKDNYSGELRGFGFITMPSKSDAQKAIQEANNIEIEGRTLIVNEARPQKDRKGGRQRSGRSQGYRSRSW